MKKMQWLPDEQTLELRKKERELNIIGNETRLSILTLLSKSNEKLNFNQIADRLKINKSKLAYHIALLRKTDFVANELKENKEGKVFSFYSLTEKGKKYLTLIEKISEDIDISQKKKKA